MRRQRGQMLGRCRRVFSPVEGANDAGGGSPSRPAIHVIQLFAFCEVLPRRRKAPKQGRALTETRTSLGEGAGQGAKFAKAGLFDSTSSMVQFRCRRWVARRAKNPSDDKSGGAHRGSRIGRSSTQAGPAARIAGGGGSGSGFSE